ncbi:L,D-transpeptidase family protein [Rhizobium sp. PP-F2F-G48]|uniref:L,D-transpeptidase family protein n=1 Tax=Rhizobium sp. PP-F2F-G48 TaxID=2135651 RepID=UPI00104416E1|nr:L,D-transpeptidase family protein [Rhizobium sp. PP-F2F-G48]
MRFPLGLGLLLLALASTTAYAADGTSPLQIVVSKDKQSLVVYDGASVVATSKVSSGKRGHDTPTGIFSILEKSRYHESNIYSNAPMPFMQRLTWSGIALHASNSVPSYPASHGCVRLPNAFAKTLFKMTERGWHVVISDRPIAPQPVSHGFLFQPSAPEQQLLSDVTLRPAMSQITSGTVEVAMSEPAPSPPAAPSARAEDTREPIRILITRRGMRELTLDVQAALNGLGYDAGVPDGALGSQSIAAIRAFELAEGREPKGRVTPELVDALFRKANLPPPANGQLLVRRAFTPLFEAPVTIAAPEIALGAHFYQFQDIDAATGKGSWFSLSLDNVIPKGMKSRLGITTDDDAFAYNAATRVLDRIQMTDDLREKVEDLLAPGSSLTVSDMGLGPETGRGTDFVTITHPAKG